MSQTCTKCGGTEILVRYHAAGCNDKNCSICVECTYGSHAKRHDEHLHFICQTCQFDWVGDVGGNTP